MGGGSFGYFLDLFFVLPVILIVRALFPQAAVFRIACIFAGLWLLYGQAPRLTPFLAAYWVRSLSCNMRRRPSAECAMERCKLVHLLSRWPRLFRRWCYGRWLKQDFLLILHRITADLWHGLFHASDGGRPCRDCCPVGAVFPDIQGCRSADKGLSWCSRSDHLRPSSYYGLFPPILPLGPISEYEEVRRDGRLTRLVASGDIAIGLFRIAWAWSRSSASACCSSAEPRFVECRGCRSARQLGGHVLYGLFFYANFSGFSEVSIGAARILGVRLKENFANPS